MPDRIDKLFVYGALAPGRPNAHILANVPGTWQKAIVRGRPLQGGWGAQQGFPGILVDHTADPVEGYVFTSNALAAEWERLDRFEDTRYQRVTSRAVREDGKPSPHTSIRSSDELAFVENTQSKTKNGTDAAGIGGNREPHVVDANTKHTIFYPRRHPDPWLD